MFEINIVISNSYIFILAVVLALLEIQIEAGAGWAKNLPTWRPHSEKWYARLHMKLMSGKELTGYHMAMFSFVFMIFHLPYFMGREFALVNWFETLSLFFIFTVVWDFLWLVLNPHFSMRDFRRGGIEWHVKWIFVMPADYIYGIMISGLILLPILFLGGTFDALVLTWVTNITIFAVLTLITALVSKVLRIF